MAMKYQDKSPRAEADKRMIRLSDMTTEVGRRHMALAEALMTVDDKRKVPRQIVLALNLGHLICYNPESPTPSSVHYHDKWYAQKDAVNEELGACAQIELKRIYGLDLPVFGEYLPPNRDGLKQRGWDGHLVLSLLQWGRDVRGYCEPPGFEPIRDKKYAEFYRSNLPKFPAL